MALDPVNHKDLKGKHKNAKDKDIDNDNDVDSSDEYLHKRRQAVSKAIGKIKEEMAEERKGLWDNIHAKRKRIAAGSGEKMRKPGSKGAPTDADFRNASESVEHITESENRDYIKTVLSRHLNHNKVTHKVSFAVGYDKFDVGNNTHISHDGVGLSVKHKGKEVAYYSKPRLDYKDAAKAALKHSMNEEVEQIDEIQINWNHKTQKYHTIKHPDGSHWGVFDHSSYGTKGHEIRKIKDSDGNALKASDSRENHSAGYKSGMGSPSDAAKAWAKKHGGTITNHKIKEETEELDEAAMEGNWARVSYDYSEDWWSVEVYKNGKVAAKDHGYFGANETGNPLIKKFTDLVKKAGLKPEGLAIVDEDGKKGVFKGNTFKWGVKEEVELDEISRDLARRYIRKVADKTNTGELSTKQVMKRRPGVNLAGKKAYPGIAGEPKVRATESAELKTEAKDGDGANIVRDREFKEPKFKFKSHPYGSPEWHANKAADEKFKAQQAAKAAKKAMKNEEVELDELNKSTLGSYIKRAAGERGHAGIEAGASASGSKDQKDAMSTMKKRLKGIKMASDRLTKEEVEKKPTELPADKKPLRMKLAHFRHHE